MAAIVGLGALKEPCDVKLYSDSQYLVNGIVKGWAKSWQKNGWIKSDKKPALNSDLWERLLELIGIHNVEFVWVRGHNDHPENERCDALAVAAGAGAVAAGKQLPPDTGYMPEESLL